MSRFQVKKVSGYNAGYPEMMNQGNIPVLKKIPIKLFSIFVVGFIFLLTAPGCHILFPGWEKLSGDVMPDCRYYDCWEGYECNEQTGDCEPIEEPDSFETGDTDVGDSDIVDVECFEDEDCPEYQFCNTHTGECYSIDGGAEMDCRYDGCWEGYECNEETGECELSEKPDHKEFPDENADDFETDGEDIDEDDTDDDTDDETDDEDSDYEDETDDAN